METAVQDKPAISPNYQTNAIIRADDLIHGQLAKAPQSFAFEEVKRRLTTASGSVRPDGHLLTIMLFSRAQALHEGRRVFQYLKDSSPGTVALIERGFYAWIDPKYPEDLTFNRQLDCASPSGGFMGILLSGIGDVESHEFHGVAKSFRAWLESPAVAGVSPDLLAAIPSQRQARNTA